MKSLLPVGSLCLLLTALTGACFEDVTVGADSDGGGPASCVADSDCKANNVCAFLEADGCSAKGQCVAAPTVACAAYEPGCACDGTEINASSACVGLPDGYDTKPLAHVGACAGDGGPETGAPPDGGSVACTTAADCTANGLCAFLEADGCSAKGHCVPAPLATCAAYEPGCACDGTDINASSACVGVPDGYDTKPLAHLGACVGDGGGGVDTGTPTCVTNTDCSNNGICGFLQAEGCNAKGMCFPAPTQTCALAQSACGCEGTDAIVVAAECNGLPSGYYDIPFAYLGSCGADAATGG